MVSVTTVEVVPVVYFVVVAVVTGVLEALVLWLQVCPVAVG